jgi:folate-binding protein YgfZ
MATEAPPDLAAQYRALRDGAGLVDRSDRGKVGVTGPDAAEFLQGQVTNDVLSLAPGTGCYAAMLTPKGRILADMRVLARSAEDLWLDTEPEALEAVLRDLRTYRIGRQVEIADRTAERAILSLIGPRSAALAPAALVPLGLELRQDLPGLEHSFALAGPVVIAATDTGVDLLAPAEMSAAMCEALVEAGALPIAEEAAEIVRVERGRPRFGRDMTDENLPGEAGIVDRAVSFTKGCYVGQEPVARMYHRGHPNRLLRGLGLTEPAEPGSPVLAGDAPAGRAAGRITSACVSPALGPIALAMVRREVQPGDRIAVGEGGPEAVVVELPFPPA